jgi:tetratricopeptide (TPR) repeat protein
MGRLGIIFVLCGGASMLCATDPEAERSYVRALEFVAAGDAVRAEAAFHKAWETDPTDARYVRDLTIHYIHGHEYSQATQVIRDYVHRLGPTALAWTLQGELLFEQKQYDPAFQSLRSALDLSSENYRAHELVGLIFAANRRYALALDELKIAAQQNSNSAQVHFYCGRLYYQAADYPAARDEFLQCLRLQPNYPDARANLGLAYEALQEPARAEEQYRQAIEADRSGKSAASALPYVCQAVMMRKNRDSGGAAALLNQALERDPRSAWANFEQGKLLFDERQDAAAEPFLKKSAELDEHFSRPHFFLGRLYQRSGRVQEANQEFATFQQLDRDPDNRQPQMTR